MYAFTCAYLLLPLVKYGLVYTVYFFFFDYFDVICWWPPIIVFSYGTVTIEGFAAESTVYESWDICIKHRKRTSDEFASLG
jgi:hypothetical protein